MSTPSGLGNKVDKNKGKFKVIEINKVYKGTSVEPQRNSGGHFFCICIIIAMFFVNLFLAVCNVGHPATGLTELDGLI